MRSIRDLALLIFTLSPQEKKTFESFVSKQGKSSQYMTVYESLVKILKNIKDPAVIPSEPILLLRLKVTGNKSGHASYLFKNILRALRTNLEHEIKEMEIINMLGHGKILAKRGLFESAIFSFEDALKMAKTYQYQSLAIQALKEMVYLEGQRDSKSYSDNIKKRIEEIDELSNDVLIEQKLFNLHHRCFLYSRNRDNIEQAKVREELDQLASHPLLQASLPVKTFFAEVYRNQALASLAHVQGDMKTALTYSQKIVELWQSQENSFLQSEFQRSYIIHLNNYISFAISQSAFDSAEKQLAVIEDFPCRDFDDEAEKFQNYLFSKQLLLLNTNRLKEGIAEINSALPDIEGKYIKKINVARKISLFYNTMMACFMLGQYKEAEKWCIMIYNIGRTEQRLDIQFTNKVFQIIIRFELGAVALLDQEIKNTMQNLIYHGQNNEVNKMFLFWLNKLVKNRQEAMPDPNKSAIEEKKIFFQFKKALEAHKEKSATRQIIGLAEVLFWVTKRAVALENG